MERKMQRIIILLALVCLFAGGCAATIKFTGDCDLTGIDPEVIKKLGEIKGPCVVDAKDYAIKKTIDKNGKITWSYLPKSSGAAMTHELLDVLDGIIPLAGGLAK